jgi:hypothetical protein
MVLTSTEETNEIALPFNTVSAPGRVVLFAGADNVPPLLITSNHYTTTGVVDNC